MDWGMALTCVGFDAVLELHPLPRRTFFSTLLKRRFGCRVVGPDCIVWEMHKYQTAHLMLLNAFNVFKTQGCSRESGEQGKPGVFRMVGMVW
jgi:hypothetical protein